MVRNHLFSQKPPGSRLRFSRTGVQHSPGSSTIELPPTLAESGAYSPDRPGFSRQCPLRHACHHLPKSTKLEIGRGAPGEHHPQPTIPPRRLNRPAESRRQPVGYISRGYVRPYTRRKDPSTLIPQNQVLEGDGTRYPPIHIYIQSSERTPPWGKASLPCFLLIAETDSIQQRGEGKILSRLSRQRSLIATTAGD